MEKVAWAAFFSRNPVVGVTIITSSCVTYLMQILEKAHKDECKL